MRRLTSVEPSSRAWRRTAGREEVPRGICGRGCPQCSGSVSTDTEECSGCRRDHLPALIGREPSEVVKRVLEEFGSATDELQLGEAPTIDRWIPATAMVIVHAPTVVGTIDDAVSAPNAGVASSTGRRIRRCLVGSEPCRQCEMNCRMQAWQADLGTRPASLGWRA